VGGETAETMKFGVGEPVRGFEDVRLVTGRGRYQDDVVLPRQAYAVFLRSPHAHARIASIDTAVARAAPGVPAVYTGADYKADGLSMPKADMPRKKADGSPMFAARPDAPRVWDENLDNISHRVQHGNKVATDAAFAKAAHVVRRRYVVTRVHAQYMERAGQQE
jgi:carbon-monoxide dehydrogenase large subunit